MSAEAEASAEQRKKRPAAKQPGTAIILCEYDGLGRVVKETVNTVPETVLYYEYDARGNVTKFTDAAGTVFKRIYTKTDLLKEEKVYAKGNTSETPDETRRYSYDEGGALKSVSDGDNTVYYNGADSEYQPDAYGKTRKEKWSRTGFEMSYDYDS
ncbi:YD repeat-containing protein, partial [Treponema bryantii]